MSKQTFADAPVLKWFGAASYADLNYKRRNMHSNNTQGNAIYKKVAVIGIHKSRLKCFSL